MAIHLQAQTALTTPRCFWPLTVPGRRETVRWQQVKDRNNHESTYLLAATIIAMTTLPVLASSGDWKPYLPGHGGNAPGHGGNARGAPAPFIGAGAGLPVLAVGYGVYWLIQRRRKSQ